MGEKSLIKIKTWQTPATGNYKTLMKEWLKDTDKWKDILVLMTWKKWYQNAHAHNVIYGFNEIPVKIPMAFFTDTENNSKIYIEPQKTQHNYSTFEQDQSWRLHAPWFPIMLQSYNNQNNVGLA